MIANTKRAEKRRQSTTAMTSTTHKTQSTGATGASDSMCDGALRAGKAKQSRCLFQTRKGLVIKVVGRKTRFAPENETGAAELLTGLQVDQFVFIDTSTLRTRRLR
jgi:hypothetical protein